MNSLAVSSALLACSLLSLPPLAQSQALTEAVTLSSKPPVATPPNPLARITKPSVTPASPARPTQHRAATSPHHASSTAPARSGSATPAQQPLGFSIVGAAPAPPPRKPPTPDTAPAPAQPH